MEKLKPCWEIDAIGNIIEHYLFTDKEIEVARNEGRKIVDFPWTDILFTPKFDINTNAWVDGKSQKEIDLIKQQMEQAIVVKTNEQLQKDIVDVQTALNFLLLG
jgi:hypothetical protein